MRTSLDYISLDCRDGNCEACDVCYHSCHDTERAKIAPPVDALAAREARAIMPGHKWQAHTSHVIYKVMKIDRRAGKVHLSSTIDVRMVTPTALRKNYDRVEVA